MNTRNPDRTLERYAQEFANDPEFIAEGLAIKVTEDMLEILEQEGKNQSWLAQAMGVSRAHISRILNAPPNMTFLTLARIAVALGVTPDVELNSKPTQVQVVGARSRGEDIENAVLSRVAPSPPSGTADAEFPRLRPEEGGYHSNAFA